MKTFRLSLVVFLSIFFISLRAFGACTPCTATYALQVHYSTGGNPLQGVVTGSAQVSDGTLDLNVASVQGLVMSQISANAALIDVISITLNGGSPGAALALNDTLVASNGGVIAWVDTPLGPNGRLHYTTVATQTLAHPFSYVYKASGTESPLVTFTYKITATGNETYHSPTHQEQNIAIGYYLPSGGAECRTTEGDVCLPVGCKRQSSKLVENNSSRKLDNQFYDSGDRCVHYKIRVSSTNAGINGKDCDGNNTGCWHCGAWYDGTVVLDGYCDATRPWSRTLTGTGQAEGNPATNFTLNYTTAGGLLGSGLPDALALSGSPSYFVQLSNCSVACSTLNASMNGNILTVSTAYAQSLSTSKNGSGTLASPEGTKLIDTLPFTTENNDVRHSVDVTFQNTIYRDQNNDGFVDVGPFAFWSAGTNADQLMAAFDRTGIPVATIDSITPNPALFGQPIQFIGHGSGPFTTYQWFTHRTDQVGGPLLGTTATFTRNNLNAGVHQIRLQVAGTNASPFTYSSPNLVINQPPVAFINYIENANDPLHPSVSLLLHDGAQSDPFTFDGGGIDLDGSVTAYEWSSNIEPGNIIGTTAQLQKSLTALGTHTIALRVKDNLGAWSLPVMRTVVVRRPPVLLVHGFCGDNSSWDDVINNGWLGPQWATADIVRRTFDANGDGVTNDSPADNAQLVWQQIQQMKQTYGVRTVDELVHSMGGLDSRAYIESPSYQGDVNKLVMLATPNHGSSIADLTLMTNGYSQQDVELYIPIQGVQNLLLTLGVVVDIVDWFDPTSGLACLGQDSPALHALRPHSDFLRNLNHTYKDDGTEDFGASGQPNDYVPSDTQYFVIHGGRVTVSHTHLPNSLVLAIRAATGVNLTHMSLIWARDGDAVVTSRSARLDGIPSAQIDHRHRRMEHESDSVRKGLFYLLDDPPPAERDAADPAAISGAHLLGAGKATLTAPQVPAAPVTLNVDGAAQRLRVSVTWGLTSPVVPNGPPIDAQTRRVGVPPSLVIVLTSPSGVIDSSDAPKSGFTIATSDGSVDVTLDKPEAGKWKLEVRTPALLIPGRGGLPFAWLAFEESGAFVALGLSADNVKPGDPVTIAAYVQNNGTGVLGADVRAAVSSGKDKEKPTPLTLIANPRYSGLYTATFTPTKAGTFRVLAAAKIPGSPSVTRFDFVTFDSRLLPDLAISLSGNATNLTAKADNRGQAAAAKIPVRFFDGLPAAKGRLLAERIVNLAPASSMTVSIPWSAAVGTHKVVAVIDPSNTSGEANTADNVATLPVDVRDTTPPIARAGADQTAAVGQHIVLDGRASTDNDRIASYSWAVVPEVITTSPPSRRIEAPVTGGYVVFPAFSAGTYTIRLTVTDPSGNKGTDDLIVTVFNKFDSKPPIANAGPDITVAVGAPVKFNGLGSSDDFGIALATWDIDVARDSDGDGNPANDQDLAGLVPTLQNGYPKAGVHRARLTVRDAVGNGPSTDEVLVNVGVIVDPGTPISTGGTLNSTHR